MSDRPYVDPAAQNERTALAWQRTALSVLAGSAVLGRLGFEVLGAWSLLGVAVAAPLSGWLLMESRFRYGRPSRGGRAPAALAVATSVLALLALGRVVLGGS
jgi:uncharacterized membrane protein YidH (DUF202 family)